MRELAGVIIRDVPRYVRALGRTRTRDYLMLCNRNERLERSPEGEGARCDWRWSSDLHAPKHLPALGAWLMRRALADHPVRTASQPAETHPSPEISFIIGHRGEQRLPLLMATLRSIAAQEGVRIECVVVQQESQPTLAGRLPGWVRLVHTPPAQSALPFCRSWAFNVGAKHANAPVLVLHDNDMLVPADYAAQMRDRLRGGWDAANLKRFVFYLDEIHSAAYLGGSATLLDRPPLAITQNLEGGGSVAITREAFERIGGMDESFIGWGGEDNEFWERAGLLRTWSWADLPLVHLWHPAQAGKYGAGNPTLARYRELAAIPAEERVAVLRRRLRGQPAGPYAGEPQTTEEIR
jgi:hypothetical protein